MDKWLKTGTLKRASTSIEIQPADLAAASTSKQSHDLQAQGDQGAATDRPVLVRVKVNTIKKTQNISAPPKKRKYFDEYLRYGFSFTGDEDCLKPLCVVCGEILSNGGMKPSFLMRHLETKHTIYKQKDVSFFQRLSNGPNLTSFVLSANKVNENAVEASYRISYHIAKSGKNHTIAENLISPCIKDAVECMFGEDHVLKINNIPFSNNTVSRRFKDLSDDIESTVIERIKKSPFFSIQVDESTDVSNLSILLVIARYLNDNVLEENLLLCHPLTERCTGEDIFNAIQGYFCEKEIDWANCCGVCTDGGKSMSGCYTGLRGRIKEVAPHVAWSHCCIHRQSLATKPLPHSLKEVLNQSVKVVNFIKANSTNSRLFKSLCEEMDSLHTTLLFHTEVRWLSRGKVLTRLFELRHEVQVFFEDQPFELSSKFHESEWLQQLAYLSDIFSEINKLNLGLQNSFITIFKVSDKIESMIKKLDFWESCIKKDQCEVFETLHSFLSENELKLSKEVKSSIIAHLKGLKVSFRQYFPKRNSEDNWISNPFNELFFQQAEILSVSEKEKLIELSTDSSLQSDFKKRNVIDFWAAVKEEYQELSDKAIKYLLPFTNTELVERAFSSYAYIKNKYRNKLDAAPDLRLYLSSFEPDFKKLSSMKQAQGSH